MTSLGGIKPAFASGSLWFLPVHDGTILVTVACLSTELTDPCAQVFLVDVWVSGRHHTVERRYTEFEELHKQVKKMIKTPEFPPKKVLKWNNKVLEQRRLGLEAYLQGVVCCEAMPKAVLHFLEIKVEDDVFEFEKMDHNQKAVHQAVITFPENAFLQDIHRGTLPDIVAEGVTIGLFDSDYKAFPS